jgi:hypothetical protein
VSSSRKPSSTEQPGGKRPSAQQRLAAQRTAAARERIAAAERRRRTLIVGGVSGAVLVIVLALVLVKVLGPSSSPKSGQSATAASNTVAGRVTSVPPAVFDQVGVGTGTTPPSAMTGAPLTAGGQPRVLYVGAEFCPYCAATRWPLAVALSRFGTLTGLGQTRSSPSDVYPSTATLSFHGASYTSKYFSFTGKEIQSNKVVNGQYTALDSLDAADTKLFAAAGNSYPFLDIGGKYELKQAPYNPQLLHGLNQEQIAADLSQPSSPVGRAIIGASNDISAAICKATGGQPGSVCNSSGVKAAAAKLPTSA